MIFTADDLVAAVRASGSRLDHGLATEVLNGQGGFCELGLVERRGNGGYSVTERGHRLSAALSIARLDPTEALPLVSALAHNHPHAVGS